MFVQKEILSFYIVDKELVMKSNAYDSEKISDYNYVASVMFASPKEAELPYFMNPVIHEFERLKAKLNHSGDNK